MFTFFERILCTINKKKINHNFNHFHSPGETKQKKKNSIKISQSTCSIVKLNCNSSHSSHDDIYYVPWQNNLHIIYMYIYAWNISSPAYYMEVFWRSITRFNSIHYIYMKKKSYNEFSFTCATFYLTMQLKIYIHQIV